MTQFKALSTFNILSHFYDEYFISGPSPENLEEQTLLYGGKRRTVPLKASVFFQLHVFWLIDL